MQLTVAGDEPTGGEHPIDNRSPHAAGVSQLRDRDHSSSAWLSRCPLCVSHSDLDVSENRLSGSIPSTLSSLTNLE